MQEGIIKFNVEKWNQTNALDKLLWENVELAREKLYSLNLIGYDYTHQIGFGNISMRLLTGKSKNSFIISGSQTGKLKELNGNHFSIVTGVDFKNNSVICDGPMMPSSEAITHAACYFANSSVQSVIHIHSMPFWQKLLNSDYSATPEYAEYGSISLYHAIIQIMKEKRTIDRLKKYNYEIIVMKGHKDGIIIFGSSLNFITDKLIEIYNSFL